MSEIDTLKEDNEALGAAVFALQHELDCLQDELEDAEKLIVVLKDLLITLIKKDGETTHG